MKIKFYKYFGVILAFLAISCEADRAMPEQNNTFTLEQAKHFHMEHATDLRLPGTGGGSVKSSIDYNEILVPQWDKATYHEVQFPSKLARTYEVPLNTGSIVGGVLLKSNAADHDVVTMKSSLVIQEFSQGENTSNRQMVVTVLGKDSDNNPQSDAFTYMGSHKNFTGFMVVSTLEGEIVNIFQYLYGQRSMVYVRKTEDAPINAPLSGFSFLKAQGTKSSYGNSEPGICYMCGKEGMVYIGYGHICESCLEGSELLDGTVVTDKPSYCDKCGELKGKCICDFFACSICGYEPCQCDDPDGRCEYCGEIGCNGECRESGKEEGENNKYNELSDAELEALGENYIDYINSSIQSKNYTCCQLNLSDNVNSLCNFTGAVSSIEGLWASFLTETMTSRAIARGFGWSLSSLGIIAGGPTTYNTIVAVVNGDCSGLSTEEILTSVSTVLGAAGIVVSLIPAIAAAAPYIGFSACVFGVASLLSGDNANLDKELQVELSNGSVLTVYIA